MGYTIKELEQHFRSLGGHMKDGEYVLPLIDNAKIRHLDGKITAALLEYRHTMEKNAVRAMIPSYKRKMLANRDLAVKEYEGKIEAEREKHPNYVEAKAVKTLLDLLIEARHRDIIHDVITRQDLVESLEACGGKVIHFTGKRRTRLHAYEPPVIESDSITTMSNEMSDEMIRYTNSHSTIMGKIPAINKKIEKKHLRNIEMLDLAIRDEKMQHPNYANATLLISILQAMDAMESMSSFDMGKI